MTDGAQMHRYYNLSSVGKKKKKKVEKNINSLILYTIFPPPPGVTDGGNKYYANRMQIFEMYIHHGNVIPKRSCVIDYYCRHIIIVYIDL